MQRRNFIKNTSFSLAGLVLCNGVFSKNNSNKKSLTVVVLMSGGVRYSDIINSEKKQLVFSNQQNNAMNVICKTKVNYTGKILEHTNCLLNTLAGLSSNTTKNIFISNSSSEITKAVALSQIPLNIISTESKNISEPYRNDLAVFENAAQFLKPNENLTLVLNLEDTDIAHSNMASYRQVLNFYTQQINIICAQLFAPHSNENICSKLIIASTLGRNEMNQHDDHPNSNCHHYEPSARKLFCIETSPAKQFNLSFDHQPYESNKVLSNMHKSFI
jgi:uncharacterized protein (UPF0333 family)